MESISVAISPCPNDTFAFYYFLHKAHKNFKIEKVIFEDIQKLNELAEKDNFSVIKVSAAKAAFLLDRYEVLKAGSAIGYGVGPLLLEGENSASSEVALPGKDTSAHVLYNFFCEKTGFGKNFVKKYAYFRDILFGLAEGRLKYGVVIHEGRFIYQELNLSLVKDLGEFWEKETLLPVPLGVILVKKDLDESIKSQIFEELSLGVSLALEEFTNKKPNYFEKILPFVQKWASELPNHVLEKHIVTYVNQDTVSLSKKAQEALSFFFNESHKMLVF